MAFITKTTKVFFTDHGNLRRYPPPKAIPPINKALLRDYCPLVSNEALFLAGKRGLGGGTLGSHELMM